MTQQEKEVACKLLVAAELILDQMIRKENSVYADPPSQVAVLVDAYMKLTRPGV